jgi:hypothetical protein
LLPRSKSLHGLKELIVSCSYLKLLIIIARKRVSVIRRVISELVGRSPYEKKIMEVLKLRQANSNKKAYKLAKKRLGSHKRAIKKREELVEVINTRK